MCVASFVSNHFYPYLELIHNTCLITFMRVAADVKSANFVKLLQNQFKNNFNVDLRDGMYVLAHYFSKSSFNLLDRFFSFGFGVQYFYYS